MQASLGDERAKQHVVTQKAKDNYILAKASAIKRKREGATEPGAPIKEPQRKLCHWSYLLKECAWMSKDIRYERRWRKHMAFIIAHEAVAACDKLRKVSTGRNGAKAASRDVSSCETGFEVSIKEIKEEQGVASNGITGMKCIKSTDIVSSSLLVYDYSLMQSAVQLAMEKLQAQTIKQKIEVLDQLENLEEAQREYVACMQTPASAAHAAQNAIAGDRAMRPPNVQDAWQDGRRRQWVAGMRADGEAALARRHLPGEAAQHRRQDLTGEDDRLLMCLLTEFGDTSPTLVAEVFSSIRRLDGVHMDRNIVVARVIRPVAARMLQEQKQDYENACMKRSEMAMHMASKHESHQAFIGEALAHFGGSVPSPGNLLAYRRKAADGAANEGGGAGTQGGGGTPGGGGSGGAGGGNGAAQQRGADGADGGSAMGANGNTSAAGSPAQPAGPGSSGATHGGAGPPGGGPGGGPGGAPGNGSMPMPQQPTPQQPMQREAVPPGSYAVPAHAVHQHVHPHQVQAHAAHAQAAARGGGMVMPPQSAPMMNTGPGPDEQPMAIGPGGMMMQPQLVQVPASAAGMHPQYQSFDGIHMQPAPMHQMPRRGHHAQHGHPMHPQAMHMPMIDQDGMMTAPPMGLMHMGPPMGSGPPQIATMHPGMPQGPPGHPHHPR